MWRIYPTMLHSFPFILPAKPGCWKPLLNLQICSLWKWIPTYVVECQTVRQLTHNCIQPGGTANIDQCFRGRRNCRNFRQFSVLFAYWLLYPHGPLQLSRVTLLVSNSNTDTVQLPKGRGWKKQPNPVTAPDQDLHRPAKTQRASRTVSTTCRGNWRLRAQALDTAMAWWGTSAPWTSRHIWHLFDRQILPLPQEKVRSGTKQYAARKLANIYMPHTLFKTL